MGERARKPARLAVAAPPSTHASSKAARAQREVLGADDESALFRLHKCRGDAGAVEGLHHLVFAGSPLVGVALAGGHQARHGAARHAARRLHQHLQVEPVGKAPLNLPHRIPGEGEHGFRFGNRNCAHRVAPKQSSSTIRALSGSVQGGPPRRATQRRRLGSNAIADCFNALIVFDRICGSM